MSSNQELPVLDPDQSWCLNTRKGLKISAVELVPCLEGKHMLKMNEKLLNISGFDSGSWSRFYNRCLFEHYMCTFAHQNPGYKVVVHYDGKLAHELEK